MSTWFMSTIGDVAEVSGGLTKSAKREMLPRRCPYLTVANVYANRLVLDNVGTIGVQDSELPRVSLQPGDLLIVEGNGSLSQLGRVAMWNGEIAGCVHQNHLIKLRPAAVVTSRWLLYWLLSPKGRDSIERLGSSTSGLHTLSITKVGSLPVPICPVAEQAQVVTAIETYLSRLIATEACINRSITQLQHARNSVLKAAVESRFTPQEVQPPLDEDSLRNEDNTNLRLWPQLRVGSSLHALITGPFGSSLHAHDYVNGGIPIVNPQHIRAGRIVPTAEASVSPETAERLSAFRLMTGDVVLGRRGEMGRCAVVGPREHGWVCGTGSLILRPQSWLSPHFLALFLRSPVTVRRLSGNAVGTTMLNLNQRILLGLTIHVPPLAEQHRIVAEVERRLSILDDAEARLTRDLERLELARQAILKRAFEGRLVPSTPPPAAEPAP